MLGGVMIAAGIINFYALTIAVGFGALAAAAYTIVASRRSSLQTQARQMGLAAGSGSPQSRAYHGLYRKFYIGLEPDRDGALRVSIAHPEQDRILEKPQLHDRCITDLRVRENVLTFRILCRSPSRPGVALKPLIDSAIDLL
jgi:hypothetical protein